MMTVTYPAVMYGQHGPWGPGGPGWQGGPGWDGPPWFAIVGGTLWLLFWAAVITAGIVLVRRYLRTRPTANDAVVSALGERFARGEVTEDEYRQRLAVLREQHPRDE